MNSTSKRRPFNYLIVLISGLLLAVIITTTVVVLKKPLNQMDDIGEPLNADSSQQPNEEDPMVSSSIEATSSSQSATSTFESATAEETGTNPEISECTNPRVRRSWTELNNAERTRFLNAVNQMKKNPSKTGASPNRYEDFTVIHDTYRAVAHSVVIYCI
jgi:cytoskeletal protein RodZ